MIFKYRCPAIGMIARDLRKREKNISTQIEILLRMKCGNYILSHKQKKSTLMYFFEKIVPKINEKMAKYKKKNWYPFC
jgi:ribosome-associated translation inhibitor RaiA